MGLLDKVADKLVREWTDPDNPDNQLKRATKRKCAYCLEPFTTKLKVLAAPAFCKPECEQAAKDMVRFLR